MLKINIEKLNQLIKTEFFANKIKTSNFTENLSDLGILVKGSDQDLIKKYEKLETELASFKTKYKNDSFMVQNIEERLESLLPEIKNKQVEAIDLAISAKNSELDIAKERLSEIKEEFQLQPNLISEYQQLRRRLDIAEKNLDSLVSAKESFQLQLAQKHYPGP